jgi:hypothetical protein
VNTRAEVGGAEFGDARLNRRLVKLAEQLAKAPDRSFPRATGDEAELEATYRFLGNEKVTAEAILAPHVRATLQRCEASGPVFVAHDSTEFSFNGEREDLGRLSSDTTHGFLAHVALAVSGKKRVPLGVLGFQSLFRERGERRPRHGERRPLEERESRRWLELVEQVEEAGAGRLDAIHVMDREADVYELLARFHEKGRRFIVRLQNDRAVEGDERIGEVLGRAAVLLEREVQLSERVQRKGEPPSKGKKHPPRKARLARLSVSAEAVKLRRPPRTNAALPENLAVYVVQVKEEDAPEGTEPVEWRLVTSEVVETAEDAAAIVDGYRARWLIEEYFKSLKTGCAFEKRQLESRKALLNALAIFASIAWQLLVLRTLSRSTEQVPAETVLSPLKLQILRNYPDTKHMPSATVREAMLAIARLGGHIRNNGEPGWIVLGRGYADLLMLEKGAALALGLNP